MKARRIADAKQKKADALMQEVKRLREMYKNDMMDPEKREKAKKIVEDAVRGASRAKSQADEAKIAVAKAEKALESEEQESSHSGPSITECRRKYEKLF